MIRFDPRTLTSWHDRGIDAISITITDTGCAGHKVRVEEGSDESMDHIVHQDGIKISLMHSTFSYLDGSMITWTGKKWILTSEKINTRCGCGSSFSLKSWNAIQDKIAQMKLVMKEKKEGVHA
jgi:Fe-S cluster assembly iron-binding protein IscA